MLGAYRKTGGWNPGDLEARELGGLEAWRPRSLGGGARAVSIESWEFVERLETRLQEAWKLGNLEVWSGGLEASEPRRRC